MKKKSLAGYLFVLPIVILFSIFVIYPIVYNAIISFYDWNGISRNKTFIGFENYVKIFHDPVMLKIIRNHVIFAITTITIQALLGMVFASFFIRKIKGSNVYRILLYVPVIATPTIVGNVFSKILETNRGYLNVLLRSIGLGSWAQQWLADPKFAMIWIIFVNIWQWTGYSMLMYYASMLNIPSDIYEAADIDGAGALQRFFHITFPMLRGCHFTLFVMGVLGTLKCFDIPFVLTKGGPNHGTEFFSIYIQQKSFEYFDQGLSSAASIVMLIIAMVITLLQLKIYTHNDKNNEVASL